MSAPIFISYSSKDQDIAETIYRALEARGQDCWIACRDVRPGENYQEAIVRALRVAKVMLLVFTSNANNSDEIKKELVLAGRHRVTVVPVRVEDVVPNDAFTYEFATRQWIDLFKDWEREIEHPGDAARHVLQNAKPGERRAKPRRPCRGGRSRQQSSPNQPLLWGAALAAVLIVIAGAVLYLTLGRSSRLPVAAAAAARPTPPPHPPAARWRRRRRRRLPHHRRTRPFPPVAQPPHRAGTAACSVAAIAPQRRRRAAAGRRQRIPTKPPGRRR